MGFRNQDLCTRCADCYESVIAIRFFQRTEGNQGKDTASQKYMSAVYDTMSLPSRKSMRRCVWVSSYFLVFHFSDY